MCAYSDCRRDCAVDRRFEFRKRGSGGNRFVRPLLTASSVIAVMPACMLMFPNPGSPNEWPVYCVGGIHYVWPFKFGEEVALVMVLALTAHIPRKQNKAAKQHPRFLFENFAKFAARIPRKQNKAAKQHP
jgi:hypothetical protein